MAAPIIRGVTVVYPAGQTYKLPGQAAELFVDAVDADAVTVTVQITVRDATGHETAGTAAVVQSDPLTYAASATGATVTQDPSQPAHFYVV